MKKVFKFLGFGFIGLIVLGIIIGAISDSNTSNEEVVTTTSEETIVEKESSEPEVTEEKAAEEEEVVETVTVGIGEPLTVGDVTFTVSEIGEKTILGDQYFNEKPTDGAVFKMVYLTIQNKGAVALSISDSYFKLLVDGVEYSPTTSTVLIDEMFFFEQINPNLSKKGTLIFEVPNGTKGTQLHVQTGFWGTETGVINLD